MSKINIYKREHPIIWFENDEFIKANKDRSEILIIKKSLKIVLQNGMIISGPNTLEKCKGKVEEILSSSK